jgi:hypothetical protein
MSLAEDLAFVLDGLDAAGLPSMVVGGLALDALGVPRATLDVDLQVAAPASLRRDAAVLYGCLVEEWTRDPVFDQDAVILQVPTGTTPFELFFATHWLPRQALQGRVEMASPLLGRRIWVPSSEDFVLLKSAYMTSTTRSRAKAAQDALDIEAVAQAHKLDLTRVEAQAIRLGTWARLRPHLA